MGAARTLQEQRAPRYQFRESDNRVVRISRQNSRKVQTQMLNVSATGMAFILGTMQAPRVGELVALQFQVPGSAQMACYGRVVRVAEYKNNASMKTPTQVVVGIKFLYLSRNYSDILGTSIEKIRRGVPKKFSYAATTSLSKPGQVKELMKLVFSVIISLALACGAMYLIYQYEESRPKTKKKAGWSQPIAKPAKEKK